MRKGPPPHIHQRASTLLLAVILCLFLAILQVNLKVLLAENCPLTPVEFIHAGDRYHVSLLSHVFKQHYVRKMDKDKT